MNPSQNKKPSGQKKNVTPVTNPSKISSGVNDPHGARPLTTVKNQRNDVSNQNKPTRGIYVPVGGQDLHPFGPSNGGGMLYDPMRAERSRGPQTDIDYIGNPQRLPSGSVPPGARFDPFGPPDLKQQQRNGSPNKLNQHETEPITKAYYGREPDPNIEPMPDFDDRP